MSRQSCSLLLALASCFFAPLWASGATLVLENAVLRLEFDPSAGTFLAHRKDGLGLRIESAAPALVLNRKENDARGLAGISVSRAPFRDEGGDGQRLTMTYPRIGGVTDLTLRIQLYKDKPWVTLRGDLSGGDFSLGDFHLFRGRVIASSAYRTRVYVQSGLAGTPGAFTGVRWELGFVPRRSQYVSVLYDPFTRTSLGIGFFSYHRASASVTSGYLDRHVIRVTATAHYYDYRVEQAGLKGESVLLDFTADPLEALENYADLTVKRVKPQFIHDVQTGIISNWYIHGEGITEEDVVEDARKLRESIFYDYGVRYVTTGEWQKIHRPGDLMSCFGESEEDRQRYPRGMQWLAENIRKHGGSPTFGMNFAFVHPLTTTFKQHPDWIIDSGLYFFGPYMIDYSNPAAQRWLEEIFRRAVRNGAEFYWTDFNGASTVGNIYDKKMVRGFEDARAGMAAIRRAVGPNGRIETFAGPNLVFLGLIDRARLSLDQSTLGDWENLKDVARQMAAGFAFHQRFWINDVDPLFVGSPGSSFIGAKGGVAEDEPASLQEARMRVALHAMSGSFITIGEDWTKYTAERQALLTGVLPPYGQAARPLDLFESGIPELHHLKVKAGWDSWDLLSIQNWDHAHKAYVVDFSRLKLSPDQPYLVWEFWSKKPAGFLRGRLQTHVPGHANQTFLFKPLPRHPWVLSTDMHYTQGAMELSDVRYDAATGRLFGEAHRHPGARGTVVLFVPSGFQIKEASVPFAVAEKLGEGSVVHLSLDFPAKTKSWEVRFTKQY